VAGTAEHAVGVRAQREHVARTGELLRAGGGVGELAGRRGAVGRAHPRGGALERVDGDGERGAVTVGVVGDHQREAEGVGAGGRHRHAHDPGGVPQQEGHLLRRHVRGGEHEVGLVLAVRRVQHDHELAPRECVERVLHGVCHRAAP
jgi:hypothetical protein